MLDDTIIPWLTAELNLVEATAKDAAEGAGSAVWVAGEQLSCGCCGALRTDRGTLLCPPDDRYIDHMARWDPATVLEMVRGARKILAEHVSEDTGWEYRCSNCGESSQRTCATVRALARMWGWKEEPK